MGDEWATAAQSPVSGLIREGGKRLLLRFPPGFPTHGEGGIRTRDTTIFSRVLYQLSYLAWQREKLALREG
ncbi:MAG: hypothetical protein QOE75_2919 [Solirubrobacterales bacterium]|nr:hypothetical protein [Solirubrobacterales bacterium]